MSVAMLLAVLVWAATPVFAQDAPNEGRPQAGPRLQIDRGLQIRAGLALDLYRREPATTPSPVVVWIRDVRVPRSPSPAVALTSSGYAVATIDYGDDTPGAPAEVRAAIEWLKVHATEYKLDAGAIGVWGFGAGGRLAALAATGPTPVVKAAVVMAAPVKSVEPSPIPLVSSAAAPLLIVHGTADTVVSTLESQALVAAAKVAKVDATLMLEVGATHDAGRLLSPTTVQAITRFFDANLRGQKRQAQLSDFLSTPLDEMIDPVALDLGGTLYRTYATPHGGTQKLASYRIYLPPGYDTSGARRYPVIYFLHGSLVDSKRPITSGYIARIDAAIRSGVMPPTIVVLPQSYNQARYLDSKDGKWMTESILIKDLIPHIDATYRTVATRDARAVEGHSMGGAGALHIGFKYTDLFGAVTGNSPGGVLTDDTPAPVAGRIDAMKEVYGGDQAYKTAEAPPTLATKNAAGLRKQAIRVICGTEDALFPQAQFMDGVLSKLGIDHEFLPVQGSPHNHDQLLQYMTFDSLAFYGKVFAKYRTGASH